MFSCAVVYLPCDEHVRPISWIELYVLYIVRGFAVLDQPVYLAYDRPTPDKLLRAFKNLCRAVVARTLSERGDALLFKPATKTRDQLVGVGILGQNASLMCNVHVSDAEALAIAQAIICLSRRVSAQNVNKFTNGQRCFIPRLLTLNGNSGWVSTVKRLSPQNNASNLWSLAPLCVGTSQNVTFYKCKHCDRVEPSSCAKFQYTDLDCSLKCPKRKCNKLTEVCACGEYWFTCAQHAKRAAWTDQPAQSHDKATGRTADSKSSKLKATKKPEHDYHVLLQDDLRRGRKRPLANSVVILDEPAVPPQHLRKLGVILSERFGFPSSSSSSCSRLT